MIHAVYLINPATKDREMRKKSADSLIHALRMGDEIRADGVVLHPGSTVGEPRDEALPRVGEMLRHALAESERVPAAAREHGGRREHDRPLVRGARASSIDLAGGDKRIGVCLDSCHMFASGFDIRTADKLDEVVEEFKKTVGIRRLKLPARERLDDRRSARTATATRSRARARSATRGCAAFLSEPRFEKLPALFEGPGTSGHAPDKVDVDTMKELRKRGLAARKRRR